MLLVRYSLHSHSISITVEIEKIVYLGHISVAKKTVEDTMMCFIHSGSEARIYRIYSGKLDRSYIHS